MKKRIVIICTVLATAVITAYGCINRNGGVSSSTLEPSVIANIDQRTGKTSFYGIDNSNFDLLQTERNFAYFIREKYNKTVTLNKLQKANSISDLIPNYPSSWIDSYISVEIIATTNGKELKAEGKDDTINNAQRKLFNSPDRISDIVINAKYKNKNTVTNVLESREMNYAMTVVPDVVAEYVGGYDKMINYLKENSSKDIKKINKEKLTQASISFTINENGATENIVLTDSSGFVEIDNLMLELIKDMPKWKPAKNSNNKTVKQEFVFNFGLDGC